MCTTVSANAAPEGCSVPSCCSRDYTELIYMSWRLYKGGSSTQQPAGTIMATLQYKPPQRHTKGSTTSASRAASPPTRRHSHHRCSPFTGGETGRRHDADGTKEGKIRKFAADDVTSPRADQNERQLAHVIRRALSQTPRRVDLGPAVREKSGARWRAGWKARCETSIIEFTDHQDEQRWRNATMPSPHLFAGTGRAAGAASPLR